MATSAPPPAPPSAAVDAKTAFVRAVHVVFGEWSCLKLAVENEWGGPQTRARALALLKKVLDGLLASAAVHRDELEDLFEAALIDDFNIEAEDDSPQQVAQLVGADAPVAVAVVLLEKGLEQRRQSLLAGVVLQR